MHTTVTQSNFENLKISKFDMFEEVQGLSESSEISFYETIVKLIQHTHTVSLRPSNTPSLWNQRTKFKQNRKHVNHLICDMLDYNRRPL